MFSRPKLSRNRSPDHVPYRFRELLHMKRRANITRTLMYKSKDHFIYINVLFLRITITAAVAQWVRTFAPLVEGWVFESQPRQT